MHNGHPPTIQFPDVLAQKRHAQAQVNNLVIQSAAQNLAALVHKIPDRRVDESDQSYLLRVTPHTQALAALSHHATLTLLDQLGVIKIQRPTESTDNPPPAPPTAPPPPVPPLS